MNDKFKPVAFYKYGTKDGEYALNVSEEIMTRLRQAEVGGKIFLRVLSADKVSKEFENPAAGFINFRSAEETAAAKAKYEADRATVAKKADEL